MRLHEIRAICFDIGGVLVRMPRGVLATELSDVLGAEVEHVRGLLINHGKIRRAPTHELARILAAECGRPDKVDAVAVRLRRRVADMAAPPLYPDALPTLEYLSAAGFRICLLSNAIGPDPDAHAPAPPYYALADVVLHSWQIGACKPSLEAFRAVESAMVVAPQHLLNVGDSARFDIDGALAAGWAAIHLVREPSAVPHPDVPRIGTLTDLAPLLN